MRKFVYTEEMLQTHSIENMKEKQDSYIKLPHTKTEANENDIMKLSTKLIHLEKKTIECETNYE